MHSLTTLTYDRKLVLSQPQPCCRIVPTCAIRPILPLVCAFWPPLTAGGIVRTARSKARSFCPNHVDTSLIIVAAADDASAFNAVARFAAESGGVDVLLTHSPCSSAIVASLNVKAHAWGHIHNRFGIRMVEGRAQNPWLDICACSMDGEYAHTHGAIVVDIPIPQSALDAAPQ